MEKEIRLQQIELLNKMLKIAKRKPPETLKGQLTRIFMLIGITERVKRLQYIIKYNETLHSFQKGGIIYNRPESDEIVINRNRL